MGGNVQSIVIMVALLAVMYFMLIRPQNKKEKADREMRNALQVGDEIMTVGGIFGKVVRIREDRLTIASGAEKTKLEITRTAVAEIVQDKQSGKVVDEGGDKRAATPKSIKKLGEKKEAEAPATEPVEEAQPTEEPVATEEPAAEE